MNKKWYSFDVRELVLDEFKSFCEKLGIVIPENLDTKSLSTSYLMDLNFLKSFWDSETAERIKTFVQERYFFYRTKKYGNQSYWEAAEEEREIAYQGNWPILIKALLDKYVHSGEAVLFVGTANGSEIPVNSKYIYYALEQLSDSAEQLRKNNKLVHKVITGSFEDDTLIIEAPQSMSCIFALRCLTPNCRFEQFSKFLKNNLMPNGVLILSYPISYLNEESQIVTLPGIEEQLQKFEQKIDSELVTKQGLQIKERLRSRIEYIYVLSHKEPAKRTEVREGRVENEDILNQYAI